MYEVSAEWCAAHRPGKCTVTFGARERRWAKCFAIVLRCIRVQMPLMSICTAIFSVER